MEHLICRQTALSLFTMEDFANISHSVVNPPHVNVKHLVENVLGVLLFLDFVHVCL